MDETIDPSHPKNSADRFKLFTRREILERTFGVEHTPIIIYTLMSTLKLPGEANLTLIFPSTDSLRSNRHN